MNAMQVISLTLLSVLAANAQVLKRGSCPKPAVQSNFDATRYIGKWYEIQKIPTTFQKGQCTYAIYTLKSPVEIGVFNTNMLDDGTIKSIFGSAKVKNPAEPAKLEVSFFGIPSPPGPYWVLSTDYDSYAVVYGCSDIGPFHTELTWILSREPTLSKETMDELHGLLTSIGIDVEKMVLTNQDPDYCSPMSE